jgi:hypothetical protein
MMAMSWPEGPAISGWHRFWRDRYAVLICDWSQELSIPSRSYKSKSNMDDENLDDDDALHVRVEKLDLEKQNLLLLWRIEDLGVKKEKHVDVTLAMFMIWVCEQGEATKG